MAGDVEDVNIHTVPFLADVHLDVKPKEWTK